MNNPYRTSGKFGVAGNGVKPNQFIWPRELEFGDYRSEAAAPGFELLLETPSVPSGPGERYVNTSTWPTNPLRSHGGAGANVLLRWNNVPTDARAIDVVVHLHGFIRGSNEQMLRTVAGYSGLDLSGRSRPTLGILPRGRLITPEEVRQNQARLDERARQTGKKPAKARSDVQTFPGLLPDAGAGLEALINGALQWFTQQRGGSAPLTIARLILTAHSGGGGSLDRIVASHTRRRVCNPDEVHAFDALYSEAGGLKSWVTARLAADRSRQSNQLDSLGGALRVFYRPNTGTQPFSERLGRSLPPASDPLSRFYRIDCSRLGHFEIPKQFGPPLLRARTADLSTFGPCATGARSTPVAAPSGKGPKQPSTGTAVGGPSASPARAPLPTDVRAWIRSIDRSAIELIADEALRRRFLQQIDWSREYFPGNLDAQKKRAPGRLAEELFNAMARVTPERRVPRGVRFHDVTRVVVSVPGQTDQKLFPEARDAFVRMRDAAAADGVQLELISSWRSVKRQGAARSRQTNPNAVAPGISAHNYGLAIDLNMRVPGLTLVNVSTRARDKMANMVRMYRSPNYKWLAINASRFGWFPYKREPWHWEYNPPGLKERFEGNARAGTASEIGATVQEIVQSQPQTNTEAQYQDILGRIRSQLERRFQSPNDPKLLERRAELRKLFDSVPTGFAEKLSSQLQNRADPLGNLLASKLAPATRTDLLARLQSKLTALPTPAADQPRYQDIVAKIRSELERRFHSPHDPKVLERRQELRRLFTLVPPASAKELFSRLQNRADPLGALLISRLAPATRAVLLSLLRNKFAAVPTPPIGPTSVQSALDEVDDILDSRTRLYKVAMLGSRVYVTLPLSYDWASRYSNRALSIGATAAAIRAIYAAQVPMEQIKKAYAKVMGHSASFIPATRPTDFHHTLIEDEVFRMLESALGFTVERMEKRWLEQRGEARMLQFALGWARKNFDALKPYFVEKDFAAARLSVDFLRSVMLDKRFQTMIEVAKSHSAAAPWRAAFKRNKALTTGSRDPTLEDFDRVPLSQWAKVLFEIAVETAKVMAEERERHQAEDTRYTLNEHLRPHLINVTDPIEFVLKTISTYEYRLSPSGWIVRGGQELFNRKNEPILLLRVNSGGVVYQHLGNGKFYRQSLEGFGDELLYGMYTEAGQKSQGAVELTKWGMTIAGLIYKPLGYMVTAANIINGAIQLQASRKQLELSYESMKLSYGNIDKLVPGLLPKIWDAVLDKENVLLFNPLKHPDFGAWLMAALKIAVKRVRMLRGVTTSQVGDEVNGFFKKAWDKIMSGLKAVYDVVDDVIKVTPAIVGSTGIDGPRALQLAERKLKDIGVVGAVAIVLQIKALSAADKRRLVFEIQDLIKNGSQLMSTIKNALVW